MGSCILSRSFTVLPPGVAIEDGSDDDERQDVGDVAMVPLAGALVRIVFVLRLDRSTDALNARSGHDNARLYYESSKTLDMRTTQAIRQGAQIYNTYADPPNSDLLRRYGHVDEPNPYDVVELGADLLADVACANDEALKALIPAKVEWALEHEIDECVCLFSLIVHT